MLWIVRGQVRSREVERQGERVGGVTRRGQEKRGDEDWGEEGRRREDFVEEDGGKGSLLALWMLLKTITKREEGGGRYRSSRKTMDFDRRRGWCI